MSCLEPPKCTSSVGSFPVWSGGSLILYSSFRGRQLSINRENHLHLAIDIGTFCLDGQAYGGSLGILICLSGCPSICPSVHLYV